MPLGDGHRKSRTRPPVAEPEPAEDAISDDDIVEELADEDDGLAPAEGDEGEDLGLADDDDVECLEEEPGAKEDDLEGPSPDPAPTPDEETTGRHALPPGLAADDDPARPASLDPLDGPRAGAAEVFQDTQEIEGVLPPEEPTGPQPAGLVREKTSPQPSTPEWEEETPPGSAAEATPPEPAPGEEGTDRFAALLPRRRATVPLAGPPLGDSARPAVLPPGELPEEVEAPLDLSDEPDPAEPESEPGPKPEPEPEPTLPPVSRPARGRRRRPPAEEREAPAEDGANERVEEEAAAADSEFNSEPRPLEEAGAAAAAPRHRASGGRSWAEEPEAEAPADEVVAFAQAAGGLNEPTRVEPFSHDAPEASEKTLIFGADKEDAEPEPAYLVIVSGEEEGREVDITRPEITLGRGPDNDLVFPDIACSRRHARIVQEGEAFFVEDLDSGNGTLVNGKKVKRVRLAEGDRVEIGNTAVEFHLPPQAEGAAGGDGPGEELEPPEAGGEDLEAREPTRAGGRTTITGALLPDDSPRSGPLSRLLADPRRRKLVVFGGGALVGLLVVLMIVRLFTPTPPRAPTPEEIERKERLEARRQFDLAMDEAKTLVQDKKWRDALAAVQAAAEIDPENPMVVKYRATIQLEMASASALSQARLYMESKEWDKAVGALQGVSAESELVEQVAKLKKELEVHLLDDLLVEGRRMMESKQFNQAILKFDEVLRKSPGHEEALVAKRLAEEAVEKEQRRGQGGGGKSGKRKRTVKKPREQHSAGLTGQALALYKNGEVERAIDKAENGGASADELARLRQFKVAFDKAMAAAKNAGQPGQAVEALNKAYAIDKRIAGGQGEYRRILSERLAKAYMVKGVDAHTGRRLPEAYKAYRSALKFDSSLPKVKERLEELKREAKKLYEEAYVIKATNQDAAISKLKTAIQIIPPDDIYYTKAKKLLGTLQGESSGQDSGGEGF